ERRAELVREVLRVDERAGDAIGEILRGRHGRACEPLPDVPRERAHLLRALRAHVHGVDPAGPPGQRLQLRELDVDVRGLPAERCLRQTDDSELLLAERDRVADLDVLTIRVTDVEDRLARRRARAEVAAFRDLSRRDRTELRVVLVDAGDGQRVEVEGPRALRLR